MQDENRAIGGRSVIPGELGHEELLQRCDPATLPFETTEEVEPREEVIGQPRALRALEFAVGMPGSAHHAFVTGLPGTGRRSTVRSVLQSTAQTRPTPGDFVYLFDFEAPDQPQAIVLPPGRGLELKRGMSVFVTEARGRLADAFQSERYQERRRAIAHDLDRLGEEALRPVRKFAAARDTAVELTPAGIATIPTTHGHPLTPAQFQNLTEEERSDVSTRTEEIQAHLPALISRLAEIQRDGSRLLGELNREVAEFAIGHLVEDLSSRFGESAELTGWFSRLTDDVVENLDRFRSDEEQRNLPEPIAASTRRSAEQFFARYEPNVLVTHADGEGAPVIFETNPSHYNLFGRLDYEASFGAVSTDHRRIKPGSIHRANGGFLVLDVAQVLTQPLVWEKLKETLRTGRIKVENFGAQLSMFPAATLEPEPIDLDVKVVLIGSAHLYTLLYEHDEDVRKLFGVRADLDWEMPRTEVEATHYASFVAAQVRDQGLLHFDRLAVSRLIEQGSRMRAHQARLSTCFTELAALLAEANHWALQAGKELVGADDVERAIEEKVDRSSLVEEKLQIAVSEGSLLIDVQGEQAGQVNGLSVAVLGDLELGRPARITATVAVGTGDLVNIDRESKLSGPVHDKGFLTLSGYLREHYGRDRPLRLSASLVFEQSYGPVEGDSASMAELFALLSSLAEIPIRQGIAVTGSVNQHGQVQAVGGVNEKIEGFFTTCRRAGLDGEQGVIIPAANRRHLMLKSEVVDAVREGRFHVWAVEDVDQGLELLTGVPAGRRQADGSLEPVSFHRRVEERLDAFCEIGSRYFTTEEGNHR